MPHSTSPIGTDIQDGGYGLPRIPLPRLSEKSWKHPSVALQTTVKALLDPFRPPHKVRIRLRSPPRTPFRTVSEGEFSEVRTLRRPPQPHRRRSPATASRLCRCSLATLCSAAPPACQAPPTPTRRQLSSSWGPQPSACNGRTRAGS